MIHRPKDPLNCGVCRLICRLIGHSWWPSDPLDPDDVLECARCYTQVRAGRY